MSFDITDDELFTIDKLQREIQNKYTNKPMDIKLIRSMSDDIADKFHKLGFEVNVTFKSYGGRSCPVVEIIGRVDSSQAKALSKETDHERKRFDAIRRPKEELRKLTPNLHLLD